MIILLSPAKSLDFSPVNVDVTSRPRLLADTDQLIKILCKKSAKKLQKLMSISENIAKENELRYKSFDPEHTEKKCKPAALAFNGDVYRGLESKSFNVKDFDFAQKHLRILSGLYGLLRPLDLIQPYRLEMGTRLKNRRGKNLYEFWGDRITQLINDDLQGTENNIVLNLASNEYFSSVNRSKIKGQIININFKEYHGGGNELKFISFNAKRARGMLAKFIVNNGITDPIKVQSFNCENYSFSSEISTDTDWLFIR